MNKEEPGDIRAALLLWRSMRRKSANPMKVPVLTASVMIFASFTGLFWYTLNYEVPIAEGFEISAYSDRVKSAEEHIGLPAFIKISSIAVDAPIEKVALAADGSMDVPKDAMNTGWYEPGPRPGEIGSAVIDGHVNWFHGATAVFKDLHKVKPGDTVIVQDDAGSPILFIVREVRMYEAGADATDIFSSKDGNAHLNLITCDGVWNKQTKQYSKRLVVFADRK